MKSLSYSIHISIVKENVSDGEVKGRVRVSFAIIIIEVTIVHI